LHQLKEGEPVGWLSLYLCNPTNPTEEEMDLKSIKTDTKLVEAGRWVDEIPNMGDLRLNVRGMTSKLYTTKLVLMQTWPEVLIS
jgi:hypothetical protein